MFLLDKFIDDCEKAVARDPSHLAIKEHVEHAISEPNNILRELGEPRKLLYPL